MTNYESISASTPKSFSSSPQSFCQDLRSIETLLFRMTNSPSSWLTSTFCSPELACCLPPSGGHGRERMMSCRDEPFSYILTSLCSKEVPSPSGPPQGHIQLKGDEPNDVAMFVMNPLSYGKFTIVMKRNLCCLFFSNSSSASVS